MGLAVLVDFFLGGASEVGKAGALGHGRRRRRELILDNGMRVLARTDRLTIFERRREEPADVDLKVNEAPAPDLPIPGEQPPGSTDERKSAPLVSATESGPLLGPAADGLPVARGARPDARFAEDPLGPTDARAGARLAEISARAAAEQAELAAAAERRALVEAAERLAEQARQLAIAEDDEDVQELIQMMLLALDA